MSIVYENEYISCSMIISNTKITVAIKGNIKNCELYKSFTVTAPRHIDRMTNYAGSGLPFPNPVVAFSDAKSYTYLIKEGDVNASFENEFPFPNSYYTDNGFVKIPPSIYITLYQKKNGEPRYIRIEMPDPLKLRTLTYREGRTGPEFYSEKEYLMGIPSSAEATMRLLKQYKPEYNISN